MSDSLTIASGGGAYTVHFGYDLPAALIAATDVDKTWLLIDQLVWNSYQSDFRNIPDARKMQVVADESAKNFVNLQPLFEWLLESGFRRDCRLLAIGGGVVQDISAFICSVLLRGVAWDFIPTTLLAQCDSCIGAKSSINLGRFKNQLGTFNAPRNIFIIPKMLDSLTGEALRSGMCEVAKFHLLSGREEWEGFKLQGMPKHSDNIVPLIRRSLQIKKVYIEADEYDRGVRNLLNYGHTFGHAYESASSFRIPHGQAVSLGMVSAIFISLQRGLVDEAHFHEILDALSIFHSPFQHILPDLNIGEIISAMTNDKKNVKGKTFCILTHGPGRMERMAVDLNGEIASGLALLFAKFLK